MTIILTCYKINKQCEKLTILFCSWHIYVAEFLFLTINGLKINNQYFYKNFINLTIIYTQKFNKKFT